MVTITKYVWDTVSDCVLSELDENNAVTAVYTNEPQQYGGVLSQRRGTTSHFHHHDALGSTRFLTDSSGNVTDTYLHDAWGNSVAQTGTTVNTFKWVGKYGYYTDDSTGQVYVRARMYQPAVARWASVDPLRFADGLNLFLYVRSSPILQMDPSGARQHVEKLSCQQGDNACYCDFGICTFDIRLLRTKTRKRDENRQLLNKRVISLCFDHTPPGHPPGPPPQDPTQDEPAPRGSRRCWAWINRSVNAGDNVTGVPRGPNLGKCEFTINNFPPGAPEPIWGSLPLHCQPPNVEFIPPCLEFDSEIFKSVSVDFTLKIACGCGIGRNEQEMTITDKV
jgi:RHS repeat-associated protein